MWRRIINSVGSIIQRSKISGIKLDKGPEHEREEHRRNCSDRFIVGCAISGFVAGYLYKQLGLITPQVQECTGNQERIATIVHEDSLPIEIPKDSPPTAPSDTSPIRIENDPVYLEPPLIYTRRPDLFRSRPRRIPPFESTETETDTQIREQRERENERPNPERRPNWKRRYRVKNSTCVVKDKYGIERKAYFLMDFSDRRYFLNINAALFPDQLPR